ncbi:MAG: class I SAM-dependent methyltransferase [Formivibrio sp.]|nr:class I SAM-dependent methyltransferase [Formivibrio sp.]
MTINSFDAKAITWDTTDRIERARIWAEAFLQAVAPSPDAVVVDFGAGTGLLSLSIAERVREVIALDSSEGMLTVLGQKCQARGLDNVRCQRFDIETDPLPAEMCDVFISCLTLHHLHSPEHYARTALAALKPGGCAVVIDLDEEGGEFHSDHTGVHYHGFARDGLQSVFAGAGFRDIDFRTVHHIRKHSRSGPERDFPLFMLLAYKPAAGEA